MQILALWPIILFNGNADDESPNNNHGTVSGAQLTEDRFGNPNSAYLFDGINDYINIGHEVHPRNRVTFSAWVYQNVKGNPFVETASHPTNYYGALVLPHNQVMFIFLLGMVGLLHHIVEERKKVLQFYKKIFGIIL